MPMTPLQDRKAPEYRLTTNPPKTTFGGDGKAPLRCRRLPTMEGHNPEDQTNSIEKAADWSPPKVSQPDPLPEPKGLEGGATDAEVRLALEGVEQ